MQIGRVSSLITPKKAEVIERVATWVAPALLIPTIRYSLDDPKTRDELFVRDFTAYAIGAITFLSTMAIFNFALMKTPLKSNLPVRRLASFAVGLGSYVLYAGVGAVKLSKKLFPDKSCQHSLKIPAAPLSNDMFLKSPEPKPVKAVFNYPVREKFAQTNFNFASLVNRKNVSSK